MTADDPPTLREVLWDVVVFWFVLVPGVLLYLAVAGLIELWRRSPLHR